MDLFSEYDYLFNDADAAPAAPDGDPAARAPAAEIDALLESLFAEFEQAPAPPVCAACRGAGCCRPPRPRPPRTFPITPSQRLALVRRDEIQDSLRAESEYLLERRREAEERFGTPAPAPRRPPPADRLQRAAARISSGSTACCARSGSARRTPAPRRRRRAAPRSTACAAAWPRSGTRAPRSGTRT